MRLTLVAATLLLLFFAGCGGGGGDTSEGSGEMSETPPSPGTDISMYTGGVSGTVKFVGTAPNPRRVNLDAECSAFHDGPILSNEVVVNENSTLKNVFVHVKEGLGEMTFDPPSTPVVFDQKGCRYDPHVFGVQTDQPIKILNSDPLLHNIHALPTVNRPFNFGMPKQGDERERTFKKAEIMVKIKCDVHPWMGAYCGVVDHPYYAVSGDDGGFNIANLPAGEYVLEAWHETYGTSSASVTVTDGATASVEFSFGG